MKSALVTGITGQDGSYLAELLLSQGLDVHGISRWHSTTSNSNLSNIIDDVTLHECDLNDLGATIRAIKAANPDYIFHLAAHANVHVCFSNPIAVLNNNINKSLRPSYYKGNECKLSNKYNGFIADWVHFYILSG